MLQVETAIFAMNFKKPPSAILPEFDTSTCQLDMVLVYLLLLVSNRVIIMAES